MKNLSLMLLLSCVGSAYAQNVSLKVGPEQKQVKGITWYSNIDYLGETDKGYHFFESRSFSKGGVALKSREEFAFSVVNKSTMETTRIEVDIFDEKDNNRIDDEELYSLSEFYEVNEGKLFYISGKKLNTKEISLAENKLTNKKTLLEAQDIFVLDTYGDSTWVFFQKGGAFYYNCFYQNKIVELKISGDDLSRKTEKEGYENFTYRLSFTDEGWPELYISWKNKEGEYVSKIYYPKKTAEGNVITLTEHKIEKKDERAYIFAEAYRGEGTDEYLVGGLISQENKKVDSKVVFWNGIFKDLDNFEINRIDRNTDEAILSKQYTIYGDLFTEKEMNKKCISDNTLLYTDGTHVIYYFNTSRTTSNGYYLCKSHNNSYYVIMDNDLNLKSTKNVEGLSSYFITLKGKTYILQFNSERQMITIYKIDEATGEMKELKTFTERDLEHSKKLFTYQSYFHGFDIINDTTIIFSRGNSTHWHYCELTIE